MKLLSISANRIRIRSNDKEFASIRINDLLSVADASVSVVAMVIDIKNTETEEEGFEGLPFGNIVSLKEIDCSIIGNVTDGVFSSTISRYPTTDVSIHQITAEEFSGMLAKYEDSGFCIGKYTDYDCGAFVNGNKLFQRHACLVGNTGSGKSETVAKILEEVSKLPGANVIVFDIHGEYSEISYANSITIGKDFPIPIWMFGFNSIVADILKIKEESATVVMTALRKAYYKVCPNGSENKPVYFDYKAFICSLEYLNEEMVGTGEYYKSGDRAGEEKRTKGDYNGKLSSVINQLKDRFNDSRYQFLFSEHRQEYLNTVIDALFTSEKPVKNIDLSAIPHDVAIPVIGVLVRLAYDIQKLFDRENVRPLVLFCDEAHVYIPNNFQLSASQQRMVAVFEEIAKEGRKFGITLFSATQRPSELNKTILAQCGNFIAMKLNNENDKAIIKSMLPDGNDSIVDSTTMFTPGDALVIGDASPIPIKIKVSLASERPLSRTIDFWDEWKKVKQIDFGIFIEEYLNN